MKNKKIKKLILLAAAVIMVACPISVRAEDFAVEDTIMEGEYTDETEGYYATASADAAQTDQTGTTSATQVFSYEDSTKIISGTLRTTGTDEVTRLEFYFSDSYETANENVCMFDSSGRYIHLNGENTAMDGDTGGDVQVYYGGQTPVPDYGLKCVTYYVTGTQDAEWTVHIIKDDTLKECFIAKSQVPSDWSTITDGLITKPLSLEGYYVSQNASLFTSMDQIYDALNANAVDMEQETFKGEEKQEEENDPVKTMLVAAIMIVTASIIVTVILMKKDKAKKEEKRRNTSVKKQNEKLKKQKSNENKALKELIDGYDDEYSDDGYDDGLSTVTPAAEESGMETQDSPYSENGNNGVPMPGTPEYPQQPMQPHGDYTDPELNAYAAPQQPQPAQTMQGMPVQMQTTGVPQQIQGQTVPPYGNAPAPGYPNAAYGQNGNPQMQNVGQGIPNQQMPGMNPGGVYPNYPNYQNYPNGQQQQGAPAFTQMGAGATQQTNGLRAHTGAAYPAAQGYQQQQGYPPQPGSYNVPNTGYGNGTQGGQAPVKKVPAFARKG